MSKRVLFKNVSKDPTRRVRTGHGPDVTVDIGEQTGAVHYGDNEIVMCLSEPMKIQAGVNSETQCLSLGGLHDLFIDGVRVGRAMTQEEITQRVNAGDYGVVVSPCNTVSCESAVAKTVCLDLPGLWDVEINDVLIGHDLTESRILNILKENTMIRAEPCIPTCAAVNVYDFKVSDIENNPSFPVGSSINFVYVQTSLDNPENVSYTPVSIEFNQYRISLSYGDETPYDIAYRDTAETGPWYYNDVILSILEEIAPVGYNADITPYNYMGELNSEYCLNGEVKYDISMRATNNYALTKEDYYYTGGFRLPMGNLLPEAHIVIEVDGVQHPYTFNFVAGTKTRDVLEREMLEFFASKFNDLGFETNIETSDISQIPPAFNGGPATSNYRLTATINKPFTVYHSQQWQGTASYPNRYNANLGWSEDAVGLSLGGHHISSSGSYATSRSLGCAIRPLTMKEANVQVIYSGVSEPVQGEPAPQQGDFIKNPTSLEVKRFDEVGLTVPAGNIDILSIFPDMGTMGNTTTCGIYDYYIQPS